MLGLRSEILSQSLKESHEHGDRQKTLQMMREYLGLEMDEVTLFEKGKQMQGRSRQTLPFWV